MGGKSVDIPRCILIQRMLGIAKAEMFCVCGVGHRKFMLIHNFGGRLYNFLTDRYQCLKRGMVADNEEEETDKHMRPLFPPWSWVAWAAQLRLHPNVWHLGGSMIQVLDFVMIRP